MSRCTGVAERERRERELFRRRVKELYDLGTKDALIAMILKATESQVRNARMRMGLPSLHRQWLCKSVQEQKEDDLDVEEIQLRADVYFWRAAGLSATAIAERLGQTVEVVTAILKDMPKGWKNWNIVDDEIVGKAYTNQLQGSRRGGGKKMVP